MNTKTKLEKIKSQEIDIEEESRKFLQKITDSNINAFITVNEKQVIEKAKKLKENISKQKAGKLAGLLVSVKDNIAVKGIRMTCGSKMLENYTAPYNATITERALEEQAIIIGKTNMDEFACGGSGETSFFGPTLNPWNNSRVPGGSSSGAGAALAAGLCDLSIGSDTGGSIRSPATFCGVVGFKPTYGLVSRYGLSDMTMGIETPGPMARDVYGAAILLESMAGNDPKDNASTKQKQFDFTTKLDNFSFEGKTIAVPKEFFEGSETTVSQIVLDAVGEMEDRGADRVEVSVPDTKFCVAAYYLNMYAEFASAMQKFDGLKYGFRTETDSTLNETVSANREQSLGKEVKRRILFGTFISMKEFHGKWYSKALQAKNFIKQEYEKIFSKADFMASPAAPFTAFGINEKTDDPLAMYLADTLVSFANLSGIPAGVVPFGFSNGLPVGVQIAGGQNKDLEVLQAMRALELKRGEIKWPQK